MNDFKRGLRMGIPIALGYIGVSFTYGVKAVHAGIPAWVVVLISLTNVTSAGQFAGTNIIAAGGGYMEMVIITFIINIRYSLMSFALSQKLPAGTRIRPRLIMGFGITDEIFAVAAAGDGEVTPSYFYGLMTLPIAGWTFGTLLGAVASGLMPPALSSAMELGLYAMFIAIIVPPSKKSRPVLVAVLLAVAASVILYYIPVFQVITPGIRVILAAVFAAGAAAFIFPVSEEGGRA